MIIVRHDLAMSILNREIDARLTERSQWEDQENPPLRYAELCAEIGQLRMARDTLAPDPEPEPEPLRPSGYASLEDYCAERPANWLNPGQPKLDVAQLKVSAHQVLGHNNKPGGYPAGSFTTALIRCWELADNINQAKLMSQWPELGTALYLMREGNEAGLRNITEGKAP